VLKSLNVAEAYRYGYIATCEVHRLPRRQPRPSTRFSGHVPFPFAVEAFYEANRVFLQDTRKDYGEARYWLFAAPQGIPLRVTYIVRGDATRIISAHVMTKKERS
jgi:uncharacterized DUF497 family protein